ncbi:MAG: glycosyltransferase [Candidatus Rokubacteria bacterium]|nr:glycosyltransferase [Candidatus Rokubacteria bacterium]
MKGERTVPGPVSILMPVCNEADIIEDVIEEWVQDVFRYLPEGSEFLFDDGASTDGTREILGRMSEKYPFIQVRYNDTKDGFAAAARRLYLAAQCPWVFFTDSDGQYVASEFWKLVPFANEFSVVHGAKIGRQDAFARKAASAVFNYIARVVFDVHYSDINSAFRLVKREVVRELLPTIRCMPTLLNAELLLRAELNNYAIKQVRVMHRRRKFGVSRGLPSNRFLWECVKAYRGLLELKSEFRV